MIELAPCTRCGLTGAAQVDVLRDLLGSPSRSIDEIAQRIRLYGRLEEKAREEADRRLARRQRDLQESQQQLRDYEEEMCFAALDRLLNGEDVEDIAADMASDRALQRLEQAANAVKYQPEGIDPRDVEAALRPYQEQGYLDIRGGMVTVTSRGARTLARQVLERVMANLSHRDVGAHSTSEIGYGSRLTSWSRQYQPGDDYALTDVERTLVAALERGAAIDRQLEPRDFHIFETQCPARMCAGVLVDVSASMRRDGKLGAAIEASLALTELIGRDPKDSLKVFSFSDTVKQVPPWSIANAVAGEGSTDMRAGMRRFRTVVRQERGDKQAYLVTDSEPNSEDGRYVGFENAVGGVIREALRYRDEGITLNVIMLSQTPPLMELARQLARMNLGRVVFASPADLSAALVEDYLRGQILSTNI